MRQLHTSKPFNKPPKKRFNPGDWFLYEGEPHMIVYMFRVEDEPNVWYHCLENAPYNGQHSSLSPERQAIDKLLSRALTADPMPANRVEYRPFRTHTDASTHFGNIMCMGNFRTSKSTQEMLKLKKLEPST